MRTMFRMGVERQAWSQPQIFYEWGDLFGDVIQVGAQAGLEVYRQRQAEEAEEERQKTAQAQAAAAAQTQAAAQAQERAAEALSPTILGIPQTYFIVGGVGLAVAVGLYAAFR